VLRLSKMADYGIVLMTYIGHTRGGEVCTARDLADQSNLPLPTVSKVLKSLARSELLVAHRGKNGGYTLARTPHDITVAEMITAVDGPIALTECSTVEEVDCDIEPSCPARTNWSIISATVKRALENLTLADMRPPLPPGQHAAKTGGALEILR